MTMNYSNKQPNKKSFLSFKNKSLNSIISLRVWDDKIPLQIQVQKIFFVYFNLILLRYLISLARPPRSFAKHIL